MSNLDEKEEFAQAMLKTDMNPLQAGEMVYPDNFNEAARCASQLQFDPEVRRRIEQLKNEARADRGVSNDEDFIEVELKRLISKSKNEEVVLKALKQLAELKGVDKPKPQSQVVLPGVIEVPVYQDRDAWETATAEQQKELLNVARSRS